MATILDLVGNTPLIEIQHPYQDKVNVFAKCEWYNPSGSVKDRAAANMVQDALSKGQLEGKVLIDATSGNTGIAYAMIGAALGIPVELALPENASEERKLILRNYGVTLHLTNAMEGTDGAQRAVKTIVENNPDKYFYPDQYNNDNNWKAHYKHTGPEIWQQTNQSVTHYVAGLGTTGTFCGTSRFLQEKGVHCIAVHPDNPMHGLEGWKHMETAIVPGIYDETIADENVEISTEKAFQYAKAASKYLGLMISPSAAANLAVAVDLAQKLANTHAGSAERPKVSTKNKPTIVTIFPDNAMKYLKDTFWSDHDYDIENPFI